MFKEAGARPPHWGPARRCGALTCLLDRSSQVLDRGCAVQGVRDGRGRKDGPGGHQGTV